MENNIVTIEKMTYGIDSLAHLDGKVVFVPYGVPEDKVKINITEEKPDYARAEIEEIIEPSQYRRESPCPNFPKCGGCHWQEIHPETQRSEKENVLNFIVRALNPDHVYPMEPLPMRNYRNKMELKVAFLEDGSVVLGNYSYNSHEVVSLKGCIVQCRENMQLYDKLNEFANKPENREVMENIHSITCRTLGEQQHCTFALKTPVNEENLTPFKEFFDQNEGLSRIEVYCECGNLLTQMRDKKPFFFMNRNWRVSPNSFFQNNLEGAEAILHTLISIYSGYQHKGKFLDLYCGCGTQTFLLESMFEEVYAVECNVSSYQDAIAHQKSRSASKIIFICKKVEAIFNTPMTKGVIAALHLNPPRTGLSQRVARGLTGIKPKIITYLSCNPMTFRRDAKSLKQMGYKLERVYSFDLFPGTYHMETLGVFIRG